MTRIRNLSTCEQAYVTVDELAEYLRVSEDTIRRHIKKGALRVVRLSRDGNLVRIPIAEARRYADVPTD
jgi:excisionase family DNA binding protein